MSRLLSLWVFGLAILLAACSTMSEVEPTPGLSPLPTQATSPLPTRGTSPFPTPGQSSGSDIALRAAIADLAAKRDIALGKIQVVSVEATDWPDTSLGCPQPGMFYAQVIVPGYKIVLSVDGRLVEYHADQKGYGVACDNTKAPATPSPGSVPTATIRSQLDVVKRAVADLADRLKIQTEAVQVVSVTQGDFPIDDLGCGAGKSDIVRPAFVIGWEITLEADNQQYTYRAHGGQLVACDTDQ